MARFGIDSGPGRMVTRLLITLIFFQPLYIAFGMELEEPNELAVLQDETVANEGGDESGEADNSTQIEEVSFDVATDVEDNVENSDNVDDAEPVLPSAEEVRHDAPAESDDLEEVGVDSSAEGDSTETGEGSEVENTTGSGGGSSDSDPEDDAVSEEGEVQEGEVTEDTSVEDGAEESIEEAGEVIMVAQNPTNKYVFGEGDCTLVSDGEFYCIAKGPERQRQRGDRKVYAEKDREGDREIYYFNGVEVQRITNNNYDDFAPVFDEETMRIVWQAMINDRLQIMLHELSTNVTRQITTTRENSSNPSIAGDTVVWQEWVDTNWEVMMTDVNNGGQPFDVVRLTDNAVHDMFPVAYDDMVTWQSERGSGWEIVVYDIRTEKKHTLEKGDAGAKYENPRFVLLFDSKHDNGDVKTVGYDLATGNMMELGTKTKQVPLEPVTPRDETPEATLREASGSSQIRIEGEGDTDEGDDGVVVL